MTFNLHQIYLRISIYYISNRFTFFDYICFMNLIDNYRSQIIELCDNHNVKELYLFGSVLTDQFNDSSDIDLLIQFDQFELLEYFDNYMDLKEKLEKMFNRQVDLVENQAVRNPIFRKVLDREKRLLYERKGAEMSV